MLAFRLLIPALALVLGFSSTSFAQDDALDRLLDEIQEGTKPAPSGDKPGDSPSDEGPKKPRSLVKDESDVDKLLEGLIGPRADRPDASGSAPTDLDPAELPGLPDRLRDEARGALDQDEKVFDDYLRRLLGRIDPPKDQDQDQDSGEGGPLSETMKKMREVEKRLSELDTGDQTREQQDQIVQDFDELLRRIRQMQQQQQQRQQQQTEMAGQQQQQGQDQNPSGESNNEQTGAPPKTPEQNPALVNAKDSWGHLQDSLRDVMGNVSRMMPLDQKRDLIERYFLSVAKRSLERD